MFLLMALLVAMFLCACEKKEPESVTYRGPSPKQEKEETEEKETEYIVEEINMEEETITAFSTESGRPVRYRYNLGTKFLDKYGDRCSAVHFTSGQVVKLGERNEKSILQSVQLSDAVWNYDNVENYSIDQERGVFTIGKSNYRITNQVKVYSDNEQISFQDIGKDDILQVVGRDKDIISVVVTTGHGYIQLVNSALFQDSMICIGNKIFTTITGDMRIEVPEGSYNITVANNGYGGTAQYEVVRNETTIVDLDLLKGEGPKICKLKFESDIVGVAVYIDGKVMPVGEEIDVTYGSHQLTVIAEGYDKWQKTLVVNSSSATIALDLDESETTNNTDETTDTTNTTNTTNSTNSKNDNTSKTNTDLSDTEVDYLTTISELLEKMLD